MAETRYAPGERLVWHVREVDADRYAAWMIAVDEPAVAVEVVSDYGAQVDVLADLTGGGTLLVTVPRSELDEPPPPDRAGMPDRAGPADDEG